MAGKQSWATNDDTLYCALSPRKGFVPQVTKVFMFVLSTCFCVQIFLFLTLKVLKHDTKTEKDTNLRDE